MTEQKRRIEDQLPDEPLQWDGEPDPRADEIRVERQQALLNCAAALLKAERAQSAAVAFPGTAPEQYVMIGAADEILRLLPLPGATDGLLRATIREVTTLLIEREDVDHLMNDPDLVRLLSALTTMAVNSAARFAGAQAVAGKGEVPEEVRAIGRLIATQDNRYTDQPLFIVQQRRRVYGFDTDYCDNIIWLCSEDDYSEANEEEAAKLEAEYRESGRVKSGWQRTGYMDQWEFVTACFTEQGCKDYLARDGHNLKEPRIYAEGSYRNEEYRTLRNWLLSLAASPAAPAIPLTDEQLRETDGYKLGWMEGMQEGAELATGGEKTAADVEAEFADLLPGSYYMDPPDGGSPSILEQVRRMAEDAALYRASLSSPAERQEAEDPKDERLAHFLRNLIELRPEVYSYDGLVKVTRAFCNTAADIFGHLASPASAEPVQVPMHKDVEWLNQCAEEAREHPEVATRIRDAAKAAAPLAAPSSPSVSGTVDTSEFHALLLDYRAAPLPRMAQQAYESIIAHIDQYTAQAVRAAREEAAQWISVDERLPEGECLAVYVTPNGKQRLIRAKYARQFQIEAEGDDCETEYNEDDDTFYIKAGWLECIDNWGEYSSCYVVEGAVTHWAPLPRTPQAAGTEQEKKQ